MSPYGDTGPAIYAIAVAARQVVRDLLTAAGLELSDHDFRRQCRKSKGGLVAHTLAVADVYVAIKAGLPAQGPIKLARFLPEAVARQEFDIRLKEAAGSGTWRQVTVAPDGCFVFEVAGSSHALLLEADLGDTGSQIVSKLHGYDHFIRSGLAAEALGASSVAVAFVTTGPGRARNLCRLAEKAGIDAVAVCTFAELERFAADAPIWRMPNTTGSVSLNDLISRKGA